MKWEKTYSDYRGLTGMTVSTFPRTNWGQSRVPQSGHAVTHPNFLPISCQV